MSRERFTEVAVAAGQMRPHEQRVITELAELSEKRVRLEVFFALPLFGSLPLDEQRRMKRALVMRLYEDVLQKRIEHFPSSQVQGATK